MFNISKITAWLKKQFRATDAILATVSFFTFLLTRLYQIHLLPIFTDEGIYIRWAKVAWHDASWRFISLTDGKQPLQTWATIPFLKLFPNDALLAGRLFAVFSGLFALVGIFLLLYIVFNKKTAWIGTFLYIFSPYFLFYDRMALADSMVNAFFIWILFLSILLVKTLRLDVALIFGLLSGLGLLTKSSVQMFLLVSFLTSFVLFDYKKKRVSGFVSYVFLLGIVFTLSQIIYNVQRLSPFMHYVTQKNATFVMTFSEWLQNPFAVLTSNLKTIPYYVLSESGWVVGLLALGGFVLLITTQKKWAVYFLCWLILPYFGIALLTRVLFPRYIIFFGSLLTILSAYAISQIRHKSYFSFVLGVTFLILILFQLPMWTDYSRISLPPIDRGQYIEGAASGYGIKEIVDFAREKSKTKPVLLIAEGNFGMSADVLDVFLRPSDAIDIQGYWPLDETKLALHQKDLKTKFVYVISAHQTKVPENWPVTLLQTFDKHKKDAAILLMQLQPVGK